MIVSEIIIVVDVFFKNNVRNGACQLRRYNTHTS
jgi:hypothetical protein